MQNQGTNIFRLVTVLADSTLLLVLFVAIGYWRFDDLRIANPEYYNYYLQLLVLTVVSWYAAGRWSGIFSYTSGLEQRNVTANVLRAALAQFAMLAIIVVGLKGYYYSRVFLASYFSLLYGIAWLYRLFLVQYLRNQMARGKWQRTYVLAGTHATAEALRTLTELRPELGWSYQGTFEGKMTAADELICAHAPGTSGYEAATGHALSAGMRFRFLPDMGPKYAGQMFLENLEGIPLFSHRLEPLSNWSNAFLKRIFDVFTSLLLLVTIGLWLFPLFALALLVTGAGWPLFSQRREGLSGKPFTVLKFKTMNSAGQSNVLQRWMRKTGLDELPQLVNVLFGQMSMVGPRPHTAGDGATYAASVATYKIRYWAKPGLTGLAQARGLRGGGSAARPEMLEERIRADVYYIEHWSFLLDLRIVIETAVRTLFAPATLHSK